MLSQSTVQGMRPQPVAGTAPFVLNLCSSTTPMALAQTDLPELKRFTFFVSRRFEEGRERFRLHMGYFATLAEAEEWLSVVREIYPGAWAGEAPGRKLRERAAAAAAAQVQHAAGPQQQRTAPQPAPHPFAPAPAPAPLVPDPIPVLIPVLQAAPSRPPVAAPAAAPPAPAARKPPATGCTGCTHRGSSARACPACGGSGPSHGCPGHTDPCHAACACRSRARQDQRSGRNGAERAEPCARTEAGRCRGACARTGSREGTWRERCLRQIECARSAQGPR